MTLRTAKPQAKKALRGLLGLGLRVGTVESVIYRPAANLHRVPQRCEHGPDGLVPGGIRLNLFMQPGMIIARTVAESRPGDLKQVAELDLPEEAEFLGRDQAVDELLSFFRVGVGEELADFLRLGLFARQVEGDPSKINRVA